MPQFPTASQVNTGSTWPSFFISKLPFCNTMKFVHMGAMVMVQYNFIFITALSVIISVTLSYFRSKEFHRGYICHVHQHRETSTGVHSDVSQESSCTSKEQTTFTKQAKP